MATKNPPKWGLIGIPDHAAVFNVGGRVGAAGGPLAFREAFNRLPSLKGIDFGDVHPMTDAIEQNHAIAAERVANAQTETGLTVVIGGSHDHGYSQLKGIKASGAKRLGCINIDAHLDVRKPNPLITSGSPFYLAIESGVLFPERFVEFAIQQHCNSPELWEYVQKKKISVVPMEKCRHGKASRLFKSTLQKLASRCDQVVVSFDLDAIASAFAPGVSAPQPEGLTSSDALEIVEVAGEHPKVLSLGIFELNPAHDAERKTSLLSAVLAHRFLTRALLRSGKK